MTPETLVLLYATGVIAGIVSVLVSLASIISYPVLLAVGLPPVTANITNTVALVSTGVGAALGSRHELVGLRPLVLRLAVAAVAGGFAGAALLLVLPERVFQLLVPILIAGASLLVLARPRLMELQALRPRGLRPGPVTAFTATSVYFGYFGAAAGVLSIAALSTIIDRPFHDVNAAKNTLAAFANGAAAIVFVLVAPVQWAYVVPLSLGLFTGGLVGPSIARRVPARALRLAVAACGLAVAAVLAWMTYR